MVSHPVTDGIGDNDVGGYGGERWSVTFPAETLMSDGGIPVVVAAEYGDGRAVGVSDEWLLQLGQRQPRHRRPRP